MVEFKAYFESANQHQTWKWMRGTIVFGSKGYVNTRDWVWWISEPVEILINHDIHQRLNM
jgi:hypothetical protein